MDDRDDRQLKELFQERRLEERSDIPSFERVWRAADAEARRPRRRTYALAASTAAIAAVLIAVFMFQPSTQIENPDSRTGLVTAVEYDDEPDESTVGWEEEEWEFLLALGDGESPTDFLLQSDDAWFFELD